MSAQATESTIIMSREKIINNVTMDFHTASIPRLIPILESEPSTAEMHAPLAPLNQMYDFNLFPEDPAIKFGILKIKIADTPMLTQPQVLDSSNDNSGSMADRCNDGKSKMEHAIHTLKNIVTAVAKSEQASITMGTYSFDDTVETIFQDTKITKDNVAELRTNLDQLHPRNGTDLNQALEIQAARSRERYAVNPNVRQTNITMTDGQTNQGKTTLYSEMSNQVALNCTNIFIGFGNDHNAAGLQQLADAQPNGSYFYVAEIEKACLVFGEVIHQMLYTALTDITIELTDAEIYDYKTNTWQTQLKIPSIVSEATKTYHIRSVAPHLVSAKIIAQSAVHDETEPSLISDDNACLPPLINCDTNEINLTDLSVYMLRQRTQELMFKSHQHSLLGHRDPEAGKAIRTEMTQYLNFMQQFAKEQNLEEDDMLKTLIADIIIILQTFNGPKAAMYSAARTGSQGRQTSNNVSYVPPEDMAVRRRYNRSPHGLRRQNARNGFNEDQDDQYDEEDLDVLGIMPSMPPPLMPQLSRTNTTPRQMTMMREMSQGGCHIAELEDAEQEEQEQPMMPPQAISKCEEEEESEAVCGV
jgi:von Willebrand factor type A domain